MTQVRDPGISGKGSLALLILCLTPFPAQSNESIFEESGIPEGFEWLAAPQLTIVDVYYGGRYLDSLKAIYTPSTLEFDDPAYLASLVPSIKDRNLLKNAISGPLDRHDTLVCKENQTCEALNPDVAGIVFDEAHFRVRLEVNQQLLDQPKPFARRYLPESSSGTSFLQTGNLLFTGYRGDTSQETWTFFGRSLFAVQESNVESLWDYDRDRDMSIRTLSLNHDKEGFAYSAGLLQNRGFGLSFSAEHAVLGARFGTSLRTLEDNGLTQSSRLEVFRTNRGRVEVFRDGRLIHSEFQEAGNQLINTNTFPSGAYNITIKLYEGENLLQEEERFFVKTSFLPPQDAPQYFVEAGKPVSRMSEKTWPERQHGGLIRTGYSQRTGENSSLSLAIAGTDREALSELSWLWLGERHQTALSGMVADRQRYGASAYSYINLNPVALNLSYRRLWSDPLDKNPGVKDYQLLDDGYYQASLSAGMPIGKGNLDLRRHYYRSDNTHETRIIDGLSFTTPVSRWSDIELRFKTDLSQDNDQFRLLAGLELRQKLDRWENRLTYRTEYNETKTPSGDQKDRDNHYRAETYWQDKDQYAADMSMNAFAEKQDDRNLLGIGVHYRGRYLDSSVNMTQTDYDDQATVTAWSGGINSSVMTNGETLAFGGEGNTESGLLVKLNGHVRGEFDIYVNGQHRGYSRIGNSTLINLPAFESYRVFIRPRGEGYFEFNEREMEFALYPGNVQSVAWNIEQVFVMIGQLEDKDGQPIALAELNGVRGIAQTDAEGIFQARIRSGARTFTVKRANGKPCQFALPNPYKVKRGVVLAGTLVCR